MLCCHALPEWPMARWTEFWDGDPSHPALAVVNNQWMLLTVTVVMCEIGTNGQKWITNTLNTFCGFLITAVATWVLMTNLFMGVSSGQWALYYCPAVGCSICILTQTSCLYNIIWPFSTAQCEIEGVKFWLIEKGLKCLLVHCSWTSMYVLMGTEFSSLQ